MRFFFFFKDIFVSLTPCLCLNPSIHYSSVRSFLPSWREIQLSQQKRQFLLIPAELWLTAVHK